MSINLKQQGDGGGGLEGKDLDSGSFIQGSTNYNVPVATTAVLLLAAKRAMVVDAIVGRTFVLGTGGAATVALWKAASGTAPISGTALHTGTFDMVGTLHTNQTLTLSTVTGALQLAAGDSVWAVFTGVATTAIGGITIHCRPV